MTKIYKCTETGNRYKIWPNINDLFSIEEQWGDNYIYVCYRIPSNLVEDK